MTAIIATTPDLTSFFPAGLPTQVSKNTTHDVTLAEGT